MIFTPHAYQTQAIAWLLHRTERPRHAGAGAALFLDPGLGKTAIALSWLQELAKRNRGPALVVAPLRVCYSVWPQEIEKWSQFRGMRVSLIHGPPKKRAAALEAEADIYLINPEGVPWLSKHIWNHPPPWSTLIVDESSKFKNWSARRTKALRHMLPVFSRRLILTGTPSPNGLMDLFAQSFIVDRGDALGTAITSFRHRYFFRGGYGGYEWRPIAGAAELIHSRLKDSCLRMSADEYLDLPPLIFNQIWVDLPPKTRQIYRQLEREMFAELDSAASLSPLNAGSKYTCLRQIVGGGVYDDDDKTLCHELHSEKVDAVAELSGELQQKPLLIAFQFRHDLPRLRKIWPKLPAIDGRTTPAEAQQLIVAWNAGELPQLAV